LAFTAFVVEDRAPIRESLIETLAELVGIETAGWAANEKAATAWLTDPANHWDIAIVDLVLEPGGSGLGVLNALKGRRPNQKMVVLTGTTNPQIRQQSLALGADGVFDKSMETEALLAYCTQLAADQGAG
jgi:two-component system OmpR family response regulator